MTIQDKVKRLRELRGKIAYLNDPTTFCENNPKYNGPDIGMTVTAKEWPFQMDFHRKCDGEFFIAAANDIPAILESLEAELAEHRAALEDISNPRWNELGSPIKSPLNIYDREKLCRDRARAVLEKFGRGGE